MRNQRLWWLFLAFIGIPTLYFTWACIHKINDYNGQTVTTKPLHIEWSYAEIGPNNAFAPVASYTFEVSGRVISGETTLSEPLFRDEWVADQVFIILKAHDWKVWYQASHPEHSTIERRFPWKESLNAATLLGLFAYFAFLGHYVKKKSAG